MDEIKGMSDADARKWLSKHGYGVGDIDMIMAGEDPTADAPPPPAPVVKEVAPVEKAEPKKAAPEPKKIEKINNGRSFGREFRYILTLI